MTGRTTPGGANGSATTLAYYLYESGFTRFQYGYASAIALVLFLLILAFTVFQLRMQRRWVYYEAEQG
jgi:multiple sugar transport system permease protein